VLLVHTASFAITVGAKTIPQAEGRPDIEGEEKQDAKRNN